MKWRPNAVKALIATVLLSLLPCNVFAAGWIKSTSPPSIPGLNSGWWYSVNAWNSEWYAAKEDNVPGWYWIDGNKDGIAECYAFNKDGWMYANTLTPDGYFVNADGAWTIAEKVQIKSVLSVGTSTCRGNSGGGGGSGSGSGKTKHNQDHSGMDDPIKQEVKYSYIIRMVTPDRKILKEFYGTGKPNAFIALDNEKFSGYRLSGSQMLSAQLTEDNMIFTVIYEAVKEAATDSNSEKNPEKIYGYRIEYLDIKTKSVLSVEIGEAEKGTLVEIPEKDLDGYELCPDQEEGFVLRFDKTIRKIYYQAVTISTPSEAQMVDWTIHFVDQKDHSKKLWKSQSGTIKDEGRLTINFPPAIYGNDGSIWESVETPPVARIIYGPGHYIEYIEFSKTGHEVNKPDDEQEAKELLRKVLETARNQEILITGERLETISDRRFIISDQSSNDYRIRSITSQINDTESHEFYVIGKNFVPNGKAIAEWFQDEAIYSNLLEQVIKIGSDTYYVARMGVQRRFESTTCTHNWKIKRKYDATCLRKGKIVYVCTKCGKEREIVTAPLGHVDQNRDSICDRCHRRMFPQREGSKIETMLADNNLTFTCIDEDYLGGMLYLADQNLPMTFLKGYGTPEYKTSNLYRYFRDGFQNAFSIHNGLIGIPSPVGTAYAMSLTRADYESHRNLISGGEFLLQDSENGQVTGVESDGSICLVNPNTSGFGIRIAIVLEKPVLENADRIHWDIGDLQARELDGTTYIFRCIDQNYSDASANHRQSALFLSDSVIPANYRSNYKQKVQGDGSHRYVFVPGPIVNFGESNDYKYSNFRKWLGKSDVYNMEPISIGVNYAFTGSSVKGEYSSLRTNGIQSHYIGDQQLKDRFFILSVDEALKYKDNLWKFDGSEEENPESQYAAFSKGYWLRSPAGDRENYDTGYAYVVDLVNGNIHPSFIKPEKETGDEELDVTTTYGLRPAFTMPQD